MSTDDLIRRLSTDLKPERRFPLATGVTGTALGGVAVMAVTVLMLPVSPLRPDLTDRFHQAQFLGESLLWLATAVTTFALVFRLSVPGLWRKRDVLWGLLPAAVLAAALLLRGEPKGVGADWAREMDWYRGFCGPMILWVGLVQAALLAWVVRAAAPTHLSQAGFWIAFSAGGFGSFLMQFVCPKENFSHVVTWHVTPVLVLAAAGAILGRRVLRW